MLAWEHRKHVHTHTKKLKIYKNKTSLEKLSCCEKEGCPFINPYLAEAFWRRVLALLLVPSSGCVLQTLSLHIPASFGWLFSTSHCAAPFGQWEPEDDALYLYPVHTSLPKAKKMPYSPERDGDEHLRLMQPWSLPHAHMGTALW